MCGIVGFWELSASPQAHALAQKMAQRLIHRGPDDEGVFVDPSSGVVLAQRRLSIVDLSPSGHQPMTSASGRYVVTYNGEIYNAEGLRKELPPQAWRGHSDTEVMLAAIEAWGLERALERFVGMFAIALWDQKEHVLQLVRDRLGIKPLYYGFGPKGVYFASELDALLCHPAFTVTTDPDALSAYLRFAYVPAPRSIYREAHKVPPGAWITLRAPRAEAAKTQVYWSASEIAIGGVRDPFTGSIDEAEDALDATLRDAVRLRMIADVPLGAFLSGGIDSSAVVAAMQAQSARPVRTFSIRNEDAEYDEASHARAVATHLGTDHTELTVTAKDAIELVPSLARMYDEPFGDSSQLPTYLVSRLARRHVTVALSGDGGDEVFGGYNRHLWAPRVWRALSSVPGPMRALVARGLTSLSPDAWDRVFARGGALLPALRLPGYKVHKLARVLGAKGQEDLYRRLASTWDRPEELVHADARDAPAWERALPSYSERMMLADLVTYLPDDILTKVDRASMAVSLEARVPLLDHRVVALAWRMPLRFKVHRGIGKYVLRRVLWRYVPKALVERPKMGFGVPVGEWLRGPLRDWAEALLAERPLRDAMLAPAPIRAVWAEHLSRKRNWDQRLWTVLMYLAWREERARAPRADLLRDGAAA